MNGGTTNETNNSFLLRGAPSVRLVVLLLRQGTGADARPTDGPNQPDLLRAHGRGYVRARGGGDQSVRSRAALAGQSTATRALDQGGEAERDAEPAGDHQHRETGL